MSYNDTDGTDSLLEGSEITTNYAQEIEELKLQVKTLIGEKGALEEKVKSLEEEFKHWSTMKDKIEKLDIDNECLRKEIDKLKSEISELKTNQVLLSTGQTAFLFEQSVCWYVFPEVFHGDQTATIKELFLYINGSKGKELDENQVDAAKQRWYDLREKLGWPADWDKKETWSKRDQLPDDLFTVSVLKQLRVGSAHPKPIRLKSVLKDVEILKQHLSDIKFQKVKKFIKTLKPRMLDCDLDHPDLLFD